jgi:hypothetical protein
MLPLTLRRPLASMNSLVALGDHGVAVVIEPVDQGANRGIFLIFNDRGVIERAHQRAAALKFLEKALVVDVEAERLGGRIQVGAIDKERDLVGIWCRHNRGHLEQ